MTGDRAWSIGAARPRGPFILAPAIRRSSARHVQAVEEAR